MNPTLLLADSASSISGEVDALFFFIVGVTAFFTIGITLAILYFAVRYRRRSPDERPPEIHGSMTLELVWTLVPLGIVAVMFVWGAKVYFHMNRPPDDALTVSVVAKRWMWKIQQPTGQREINELHVPVGRAVKLVLTSEDVIHSFFVPAFRIKRDALPGRYTQAWFRATKTGRFRLTCAEYCGTGHSRMAGWVVVMEPQDYESWLAGGPPPETPLKAGERLFTEMNCITCHKPDSSLRAPRLGGIFGKQVLLSTGERITVDDAYLRESIVNPSAKVVAGYQPIMPTFEGQLNEEQLIALITYVRTLQAAPVEAPAAAAPPTETRAKSAGSR